MRQCSLLLMGPALGLALMMTAQAQADPTLASGNPAGTSQSISVTGNGFFYEIGAAAPVDVTYDPNAGPWKKTLLSVDPNHLGGATLVENVHVVGPAWTDWHEEIVDPNWAWTSAQISIANTNIAINGKFVDFYFPNPLPQSTVMTINKTFAWTGQLPNPPTDVHINQWPTVPEPAAIVLVVTGLAAAGLAYICRRRK